MQKQHSLVQAGLPVLVLTAISGCAGVSSSYPPRPAVDPASLVQVNRQLQIPSGRARVYIHGGEPFGGDAPSTLDTYCSVLMQIVHEEGDPPLTVEPDRFEISEVREYNDLRHWPRIYVASSGVFEDWPANVVYSVELRLHSPRQPDVRALICARHSGAEIHWNARAYYPTLAQIRRALGDVIEIRAP